MIFVTNVLFRTKYLLDIDTQVHTYLRNILKYLENYRFLGIENLLYSNYSKFQYGQALLDAQKFWNDDVAGTLCNEMEKYIYRVIIESGSKRYFYDRYDYYPRRFDSLWSVIDYDPYLKKLMVDFYGEKSKKQSD